MWSCCCRDFRCCESLDEIAFDLGLRNDATAQEVYDTLLQKVQELTHAQEAGHIYTKLQKTQVHDD